MMAHRARVLHGEKTIRMHYANWLVETRSHHLKATDSCDHSNSYNGLSSAADDDYSEEADRFANIQLILMAMVCHS